MCGRYSVQKKTLLVANGLVKKNINVDLEQDNFNCAPGGKYPCIKSATNGKYLEMTIFGLLPPFAKPDFRRLHNARLEGIETKVSFKKLIVNSRAIICLTGFYEWQKINEKKENLVIWDADTILLKKIDFFSGDKSINYGNFNEFHNQYYATNKKILNDFPKYFISFLNQSLFYFFV